MFVLILQISPTGKYVIIAALRQEILLHSPAKTATLWKVHQPLNAYLAIIAILPRGIVIHPNVLETVTYRIVILIKYVHFFDIN